MSLWMSQSTGCLVEMRCDDDLTVARLDDRRRHLLQCNVRSMLFETLAPEKERTRMSLDKMIASSSTGCGAEGMSDTEGRVRPGRSVGKFMRVR